MDTLNSIVTFLLSPEGAAIFGGLFLISEALASIPALKANSVFQAISIFLQRFKR